MLAGVSVDYYIRMERGSLGGASESVLDALANALHLEDAERDHLFALARASGQSGTRRRRTSQPAVRPAIRQVLDAITDAPAWVRNGRHDVLAMNQLARALYSPVLEDPRRPANTTRFVYLRPEAPRESCSSTTTRSPATPQRCSASRPGATRTTRPSSSSLVSCPPRATSSASAGHPRTCDTTAAGASASATRSSGS